MKGKKYPILFLFFLGVLFFPKKAQAVIPPDFIFNIGSNVVQFFSAMLLFFSAMFGLLYQFIKVKFFISKNKHWWIAGFITLIVGVTFGLSYLYTVLAQHAAYTAWLEESKKHTVPQPEETPEEPLPVVVPLPEPEEIPQPDINFFEANKNIPLSISNTELKNILASNSAEGVVLDAREDVEYDNGHMKGAMHIRQADLKAGEWKKLPPEKIVYVMCWSGIRGKEVAEFLRTKNIVARYLADGANGWVADKGSWEGNIKFTEKYTEAKYVKLFTTPQVKTQVKQGVWLVDSREPEKFKKSQIPGSVSITLLNIPTSKLSAAFAQIPAGSKVITICDAYVNCFDAKMTGVELEKRGYDFLGRYNAPWEYGK